MLINYFSFFLFITNIVYYLSYHFKALKNQIHSWNSTHYTKLTIKGDVKSVNTFPSSETLYSKDLCPPLSFENLHRSKPLNSEQKRNILTQTDRRTELQKHCLMWLKCSTMKDNHCSISHLSINEVYHPEIFYSLIPDISLRCIMQLSVLNTCYTL